MDGLEKFIVTAKGATYAAAAAKSLPYRLGTSDIQYRDGPWSYLDSYAGEADFLGQEIVYLDRVPVWSMAYYGFLQSPRIDSATAGRVVQAALTRLYGEGRFLGGFSTDVDGYRYADTNTGGVARFTGQEWIENRNERLYTLHYFGGQIRYSPAEVVQARGGQAGWTCTLTASVRPASVSCRTRPAATATARAGSRRPGSPSRGRR